MRAFRYINPRNERDAISAAAAANTAQQGAEIRFVAGGTTLIDLMKLNVERPAQVVDINHLPLADVQTTADGGLRIGALVRNSDLARHARVKADYPALSEAMLAGASGQLRNMASTGGNLLQRTRCAYFRDTAMPCNKRVPGSGCGAIGGDNRTLAILGASELCIATNPSDMNVALAALGATVHLQGPNGPRDVVFSNFHLLPGDTPERETVLEPGDLVIAVSLPPPVRDAKQIYLKLRDRASYEFALVSAAVVLKVEDGTIRHVQAAMGGIGTKPWRMVEAERMLKGVRPTNGAFRAAADAALAAAEPQSQNGFKIELARRCLVHALNTVASTA